MSADDYRKAASYILVSRTADGLPLYFGEGGPTIARTSAIEYGSDEVDRRRDFAAYVFDLQVEVVEASAFPAARR